MNVCAVLLFICVQCASSARILGVFPIPSLSHQVVFRKYYLELAKRGHELVVITPNPALPKDRPRDNITEIDVSFSYEYTINNIGKLGIFTRGVIADVNTVSFELYEVFLEVIKQQIETDEVQKLLQDKRGFDLIVTEAYFSLPLVFSHVFKAPVIQISSFHSLPENYQTVGALTSHLKYYPNFNRNKFGDLTFTETLIEFYYELKLRYEFWKVKNEEDKIIKELFGPDAPTIDELNENVHMLFVNIHPLFANNRPVPPSVVYLGAFHLQPVKEIHKDLKNYLDNSKGIVYVSLGSNVLPSRMDRDLLDNFINGLKAVPYDVLWKFDVEDIEPLPKNIKTAKWFPQRDLLTHPNVKVFVTQGGLQSTDEAIDAGVPLVGIPILGDQYYNVHKYKELGIGVGLHAMTFTPELLADAIKKVYNDESYKTNIIRLRSIMNDQPMTSLERAMYWTEHLLKHGGAKHLRATAANVSWTQYLMIDFFGTLSFIIISFSVVFCLTVKKVVFRDRRKKVKTN